jgi:hypothetical protein
MEDFELTQRTNLLSRANDMIAQQNSISWEMAHRTSSSSPKDSAIFNSTQILEPSLDSVEPSVLKVGLQPKSYSKPSIRQQIPKYTAACAVFVVCLALPLALFPAIMVNYDMQVGDKNTPATNLLHQSRIIGAT